MKRNRAVKNKIDNYEKQDDELNEKLKNSKF